MKRITLRIDDKLYEKAMDKCKNRYYLCLNSLIKVFLLAFVQQKGIGFFIGDYELNHLIRSRIYKQYYDHVNRGGLRSPGPLWKDVFDY